MFLGRFSHNIDDKGRLTVPARFRDQLALKGGYVMQGFDQNLMVWPAGEFEEWSQQVSAMSVTDPDARSLRRQLFSTSEKIEIDRVGRILILPYLRQANRLNSAVIVVGMGDYFEIWAQDAWEAQEEDLKNGRADPQRFARLNLPSKS